MKTHLPLTLSILSFFLLIPLLGIATQASTVRAALNNALPGPDGPAPVVAPLVSQTPSDSPSTVSGDLHTIVEALPQSPGVPEDGSWQEVGPGIAYRKFTLPAPNNVFVARMTITDTRATLETSIGMGKLITDTYTKETILGQAQRYDQALNFANGKTWGDRNRVVVAINGDFQIEEPQGNYIDIPARGMVQGGWYAKRFTDIQDYWNGSGFGWSLSRVPFIGGCVYHDGITNRVFFYDQSENPVETYDKTIAAINVPQRADGVTLYTPQYNWNTHTDSSTFEILVELQRPSLIIPMSSNAYVKGTITGIYNNVGSTPIPYGSIVLSASGDAAASLRSAWENNEIQVGYEVRINQQIKNCAEDPTQPKPDWTKTYASLGGSYYFLRDGNIIDQDDAGAAFQQPRTAIAYAYDREKHAGYVYFIVVDGRDWQYSVGMKTHELAVFARDVLGATDGIEEDGGGSSTMVVNGVVVNNTTCNNRLAKKEDWCPLRGNQVYLPVVKSQNTNPKLPALPADLGSPDRPQDPDLVSTPDGITLRAVVNGIMMVAVEPFTATATFTTTQPIQVINPTRIRLGPGTNYEAIGIAPAGATGSIATEIYKNLNGVLAKGTYWWYVDFDSQPAGWIDERDLAPK